MYWWSRSLQLWKFCRKFFYKVPNSSSLESRKMEKKSVYQSVVSFAQFLYWSTGQVDSCFEYPEEPWSPKVSKFPARKAEAVTIIW